MGLYLCVFAGDPVDGVDDELEGVDVGYYADFGRLRDTVAERLEPGGWGTRFPVLMMHEDSDGEWSPKEAAQLAGELRTIEAEFGRLGPIGYAEGWQTELARQFGLRPATLADCFIDVDGEPLLERLIELADVAVAAGRPISFQ